MKNTLSPKALLSLWKGIIQKSLLKTVNVHLYTTDSREMSEDSAQKLPRLRLAGNATHARSPFSILDQTP